MATICCDKCEKKCDVLRVMFKVASANNPDDSLVRYVDLCYPCFFHLKDGIKQFLYERIDVRAEQAAP